MSVLSVNIFQLSFFLDIILIRNCHSRMIQEWNSFEVPEYQLRKTEPVLPASIDDEFIYVDNEKSLAGLVADLKNANELAIDSEYYTRRPYEGLTCLLQISSRTKDYLIDTIAMKNKLEILNEFFTDRQVLKVLHGSDNDVPWLQNDLKLHLVNTFDTAVAAQELSLPKHGLAFLLEYYCKVVLENKRRFQAFYDWRTRPLSKKAKTYARKDTHYLLWVHDILRNELIDRANGSTDLLLNVYNRSTNICIEKFQETTVEGCYSIIMRKCIRKRERDDKIPPLDRRHLYALRLLCEWRNTIARQLNKDVGYVMPNRMLELIVERLPISNEHILACSKYPVPVVQKNIHHVHQLILKARNLPIEIQHINVDSSSNKTIYPNFSEICFESNLTEITDVTKDQKGRSGAIKSIVNNK